MDVVDDIQKTANWGLRSQTMLGVYSLRGLGCCMDWLQRICKIVWIVWERTEVGKPSSVYVDQILSWKSWSILCKCFQEILI